MAAVESGVDTIHLITFISLFLRYLLSACSVYWMREVQIFS